MSSRFPGAAPRLLCNTQSLSEVETPEPQTVPTSLGEAWEELIANTLRKTVPQLLLGIWFWGITFGRHDFNSQTPNHPSLIVAFAAGAGFYYIVFKRVLGVLPHGRMFATAARLWLLFVGYTLWLGFGLPVHRRDAREWLGWTAMAAGLVVALVVVVPSLLTQGPA